MNAREIRKLIDLMNENDLVELELEEEGRKVRLRKRAPVEAREGSYIMSAPPPMPAPAAAAPAADSGAAAPAATEPDNTITIKSPMVGTFFRASGPDADPYVEEGDEVTPDTVMCIIEAMKVMNEIKAEASGKLVEILVANGEPVEYGQPLFVVQPH
jgi:acetyl-CoA carboxylase biotin carboxyl carrier protein